jgi:gamma-glutamyl hercynylcysteine S-oxide synthase
MQNHVEVGQVGHLLLDRLADARTLTDDLFGLVAPEALYDRPIPERHRIVFYVGHLEAFDWNLFRGQLGGLKSLHPEFDQLFAFGIDPVGGGLPTDQPSDWPPMTDIQEYNRRVRQKLDARLEAALAQNEPSLTDGVLLNVAVEHRLMHAETLAYMLHQLPLERKVKQSSKPELAAGPISPRLIDIPGGKATLGLPRGGDTFGWDNEFELQEVAAPAFRIDEFKVTNSQFLEFVRVGGYEERSLWTDAGWEWIKGQGVRHPKLWTPRGDQWIYRTMFADAPLPLEWPVYVSHAEATAYARWKGKKLPTEAQFHRAAYGAPDGSERAYPWGCQPPDETRGNFDFHRWDPTPTSAHPAGRSAFGVADLVGNGWEWTSTVFAPLPGFQAFPFYAGYSANFFDGSHYVMKGGSPRTAASMLRRSFRNWFQAHYQYVYAGFRCVLD